VNLNDLSLPKYSEFAPAMRTETGVRLRLRHRRVSPRCTQRCSKRGSAVLCTRRHCVRTLFYYYWFYV